MIRALCLLTLIATGCKDDPAPPAQMPAQTPAQMPEGHPPLDANAPAGLPALPSAPSGTIDGQIEVAPALAKQVAAGDRIFVMARNAATGSIIAVTRVVATDSFPLAFSLAGTDVMHNQTTLTGKVRLEGKSYEVQDGDIINFRFNV